MVADWFPSQKELGDLAKFTGTNPEAAAYLAECVGHSVKKDYPELAAKVSEYAEQIKTELSGLLDTLRAWNGLSLPTRKDLFAHAQFGLSSGDNVVRSESMTLGLRVTVDEYSSLDRFYELPSNEELSTEDMAYLDGCFLAWIVQNNMYRENGSMYELNETEDGPKLDEQGQKILVDPDVLLKKCQDPVSGLTPYILDMSGGQFKIDSLHAEKLSFAKQIE